MKGLSLFISVLFVAIFIPSASAQHCGTEDYINYLDSIHPGFRKHMDASYQEAIQYSNKKALYKLPPLDTNMVIQVVVHVVYRTPDQNVDDSLVRSQIEVLNEAFTRTNPDTIRTRNIYKPVAGNARVKFVLASKDPNGNFTTGITHTETYRQTFNPDGQASSYDYVKSSTSGGVDSWDPKKYLNIWVCNLNLNNGQRALFGYAYPPVNADFWDAKYYHGDEKQGVVLHYETIGRNNPSNLSEDVYTNEKTAIHEVGHYLGLRHIWGDAPFANYGCQYDDYIDDTPNARGRSIGCSFTNNTCDPADDFPDMVENYMDYSGAVCTNMFTKKQVDVMRHNLLNLRKDLAQEEFIEYPVPANARTDVYPNPFLDKLIVSFEDPSMENCKLTLYDMLGRVVEQRSFVANGYQIELPVSNMAIGVYWLKLESDLHGVMLEERFIKSE